MEWGGVMSTSRKCGRCGHDPACGHASMTVNGVETWYCHGDNCDCYSTAGIVPILTSPFAVMKTNMSTDDEKDYRLIAECLFRDKSLCPKVVHLDSGTVRFQCSVCREEPTRNDDG